MKEVITLTENLNEELRIEVDTDDWEADFFTAYDKGMKSLWGAFENPKTAKGERSFVIVSMEQEFDEDGEVIEIFESHFTVTANNDLGGVITIQRHTPGFTGYKEPVYEVTNGDIEKFMSEMMTVTWDRETLFF